MNTPLDAQALTILPSPSSAQASLASPSPRLRRLQITFTGFCVMSIALNFLDRATISVANLSVRQDFGLTGAAIGGLISIWSLSYAFAQLPAGFLVDRLGPRILAGAGMLVWSICQGLGGLTTSYSQLFWLRSALGAAEAPTGPSNAKVVSTWFPPHRRGLPTGVYVSGTALGPTIAPPILTGLMVGYGWRTMFVIMGLVGVVASACWFIFYRGARAARLSDADQEYLGLNHETDASTITVVRWGRLFRSPTVLGIVFGSCAQGFVVWIYGGWLPAILETQYHQSVARTGILAALPWIGGIIGALSGGYIADFLVRKGFGMMNSKKIPIIGGLVGLSLFTAAAGLSSNVAFVEIFIFLALLSAAVTTTVMWTAATVFVPRDYVASLGAIINFSAFIGATVSPVLAGYTSDLTGSFDLVLLIGAGVGIVGTVLLATLIRHPVTASALTGQPAGLPN